MSKTKAAKKKPLLPLLIPSLPEEGGEKFADLPPVRELSLKEARDMLATSPREFSFSVLELTNILKKVRLVAWPQNDGVRPVLYLEDRTLAPYVRYFVRMVGESGIARCPKCGRWFLQKRPDQIYDTVAHREAHRVIRWRASGSKKKSLIDTVFSLPRYIRCARVPIRIPEPSITYSHRRPSYRSPSVG